MEIYFEDYKPQNIKTLAGTDQLKKGEER